MLQYLSPEWAVVAEAKVRSDPEVRRMVRGHKISVLALIDHPPAGAHGALYAVFDGEGLAEVRFGDHTLPHAVSPPTFTLRGPYTTFAAVQSKTLGARAAMLTGKLHVDGPKLKVLASLRALESIILALQSIDCKT